MVDTLLMSTASIIYDSNGQPYSPRKQGAGLININDAVKTANEAKAKAENDLAVANTAKETAENSLTAVVNDLDSLSDSIKNAADNKAKVQVIRDIVAKIPGTGTDSHWEANEDNKFADIATDPINSFENE